MKVFAVCLVFVVLVLVTVQGYVPKYGYGQGSYGYGDYGYAPSYGNFFGPGPYGLNNGYGGLFGLGYGSRFGLGYGEQFGLGYGDQLGFEGRYGSSFGYGHLPFYRRHYYKRPIFPKKGYY